MNKIKVCHIVCGLKSGGVEAMIYNYCSNIGNDLYEWYLLYQHEPAEKNIDELEKIGFEKYEISNYAKQGYQSKHNLMYWYYNNYYGIGLGACSKIDGQIIEHSRSLTKYLNGDFKTTTIDETKEETMFNQIMMSLRLKEGLDLNKFKERYQEDARILYKEAITRNIEKGRLMIENDYLKATQEGQYVLNDILIDFM